MNRSSVAVVRNCEVRPERQMVRAYFLDDESEPCFEFLRRSTGSRATLQNSRIISPSAAVVGTSIR